jgi:alpha-ketoglutarate-dependent 2,4-dichlorophenoxyacetate dioxygenase
MAITITPLHPVFAAEISGVDTAHPLSVAERDAVEDAFLRYAVVVFRGQTLTDAQQVAFARQFGEPEPGVAAKLGGAARLKQAELVDISNLQASGEVRPKDHRSRLIGLGNQLWHQDSAFREAPAAYSMLYAHVVPDADGDTEYCDMRAAYDDLPEDIRAQIEPLSAAHDYAYSRAFFGFTDFTEQEIKALPPVVHPLVLTHPQTGRKSLFVGCYASQVMGWPIPEGRLLILDLMLRAAQRKFVYAHKWQAGDFVIWDNRCTMHRGRPFDESQVRDLRRVTTEDESRRAALAA